MERSSPRSWCHLRVASRLRGGEIQESTSIRRSRRCGGRCKVSETVFRSHPRIRFVVDQAASPFSIFLTEAGSLAAMRRIGWGDRAKDVVDSMERGAEDLALLSSCLSHEEEVVDVYVDGGDRKTGRGGKVGCGAVLNRRTGDIIDGRGVGHDLEAMCCLQSGQRRARVDCRICQVAGRLGQGSEVRWRFHPAHGESQRESHQRR